MFSWGCSWNRLLTLHCWIVVDYVYGCNGVANGAERQFQLVSGVGFQAFSAGSGIVVILL